MTGRHVGVLVGLLIVIRVGVLLGMISVLPHGSSYNRLSYDAARYQEIAREAGRPYRDFQVEVPPIELGAIEVIAGATPRSTAIRLGWAMLVLDLFVAAVLWVTWGQRATISYLALGLPLAFLIYFRLDLLSVALASLAVALVHNGRERASGLLLAAAVLTKIWPAVLLPLWLVRRRGRALAWSVGSLVVGTVAWVWWGGWSALGQVLTFRHASGWQVQSLVGNVVDIISRAPTFLEQGADRVGTAPLWARGGLLAGLAACSAMIWVRASRRATPAEGLESLAAVTALLVFSSVLSDQYIFWLFPWAAIAAADGDWEVVFPTSLVCFATALMGFVPRLFPPSMESVMQLPLTFIRNTLLVFLLVDGLRRLRRKAIGEPEGMLTLDLPEPSLGVRP
jgi:hypothetical protein